MKMKSDLPFYSEGLSFSCTRCSSCCRKEPGFVFLSNNDVQNLLKSMNMEYAEFVKTFCRWIPSGGKELLSLREKSNYDCILWKETGCSVYEYRPLQCRTFPFWQTMLYSPQSWESGKNECPGMGQGKYHSFDTIAYLLAQQCLDPPISKEG